MTPEQQAALRRAQQRLALERAKARVAAPKGLGQRLRENLLGDNDPTTQNTGERIGSFLNKAGESMTFGLVGDEAAGAADAMLGRGSYEDRRDHYRQQEDVLERDNPGAALTADVGGALAGALLPFGAAGTLARGASLPARMGASSVAGAGMSGIYGGMEGEGGLLPRLEAARSAGTTGAAIGLAVPLVGGAVQRAGNRVVGNRAISNLVRNAPTTDALRAQSRAAYQAVDDAGVQINPQAFDRLRGSMGQSMTDAGLDALPGPGSLTPNAARVGQIAGDMSAEMAQHPTAALPFSSLDQLRRHAGTAAGNMANRTDSAAGTAAIGAIDDFVQNLGPNDLVAGDAKALQAAITKARDTYARASRSRTIDEAMEASELYLSGGASGIRNQFKRILNSPKLSRGFSEPEKQMMKRVINGSVPERLVHLLGGGLGQMFQMGMGASIGGVTGPVGAAVGALGGAATGAATRKASEALAQRGAERVRSVVAAGGLPQLPQANPLTALLVEQLLRRGTAAVPQ